MSRNAQRLRTVLRVREYQEKKTQVELAALADDLEEADSALKDLCESEDHAVDAIVRTSKARATDMQVHRAFLKSLSEEIRDQEQRVKEIEQKEEDKREELQERMQARRMIEKLEQKRREEEAKEMDRKEQRLIDVLAQRGRIAF